MRAPTFAENTESYWNLGLCYFSSTNDYYDCEVKGPKEIGPMLEPLMREFNVDLFLAGHLHNYERSYPV